MVIHTVKGFGIVYKAEKGVFLEFSCFSIIQWMLAIFISGSSAFSKSSWSIWKFTVHVLLKPGLKNFEHYFASMCDDCHLCSSLNILWHCLSSGLEAKLTFSSPVATAMFSIFAGILSVILSQHHLLGFVIAHLEFHHLHQLCLSWCFLRSTWLCIPGCSALGEWSHHCGYLGHEDHLCIVLLCILATSS